MKGLARALYHAIFWPRYRFNRAMKRFAATVPAGSRVLEIGSGRAVDGNHPYSAARFFPHCDFIQTDVNPDFGHRVMDITQPDLSQEFDVVLVSSVLEHVYDFDAAICGIHGLTRPGGVARISVPFLFPLHDEPGDYWRFTEHALRVMLSVFAEIQIEPRGIAKAPISYDVTARK